MGSVTIQQWRGSIGSFSGGGIRKSPLTSKGCHGLRIQGSANMIVIAAMLLVYSNITQTLLVRSGVERNPGPISSITGNLIQFYYFMQMNI
jgi:hypothetical protein